MTEDAARRILVIGGAGYVGSRLVPALAERFGVVDSVDDLRRGNPAGIRNEAIGAESLDERTLAEYDDVVLLAGHSSVGACLADPAGALQNNVVLFQHLLDGLPETSRLFYASSGSVYDGSRAHRSEESDPLTPPRNIYDLSKITVDAIASLSERRCVGLRFGTVVGVSPNLRPELLVNAMVGDARRTGTIRLANPRAHRAILGIDDLVEGLLALVADATVSRGIFNLVSENVTMEETAERIRAVTGARIELMPDSATYDFSMSGAKITQTVGWAPRTTIESIAADLGEHYDRAAD